VNRLPIKSNRIRLGPIEYHQLCQRILERDHWRCQNCGSMANLHVHHL